MLKYFGIRHTLFVKQKVHYFSNRVRNSKFFSGVSFAHRVEGSAANLSTKSNNVLRHTLNLPTTQLPMKANASKRSHLWLPVQRASCIDGNRRLDATQTLVMFCTTGPVREQVTAHGTPAKQDIERHSAIDFNFYEVNG